MSKTRVPLCTNNRSLAIACHLGGSKITAIWRVYTTAELERLGMTAEQAAKRNVGGSAKYFIEQSDDHAALEAAHDEMAKMEDVTIEGVSNADAARIATLTLKLRAEIDKVLRDPRNAFVIDEKGQPISEERDGEHFLHYPGLSMHSANASDKTIQKLKKP